MQRYILLLLRACARQPLSLPSASISMQQVLSTLLAYLMRAAAYSGPEYRLSRATARCSRSAFSRRPTACGAWRHCGRLHVCMCVDACACPCTCFLVRVWARACVGAVARASLPILGHSAWWSLVITPQHCLKSSCATWMLSYMLISIGTHVSSYSICKWLFSGHLRRPVHTQKSGAMVGR